MMKCASALILASLASSTFEACAFPVSILDHNAPSIPSTPSTPNPVSLSPCLLLRVFSRNEHTSSPQARGAMSSKPIVPEARRSEGNHLHDAVPEEPTRIDPTVITLPYRPSRKSKTSTNTKYDAADPPKESPRPKRTKHTTHRSSRPKTTNGSVVAPGSESSKHRGSHRHRSQSRHRRPKLPTTPRHKHTHNDPASMESSPPKKDSKKTRKGPKQSKSSRPGIDNPRESSSRSEPGPKTDKSSQSTVKQLPKETSSRGGNLFNSSRYFPAPTEPVKSMINNAIDANAFAVNGGNTAGGKVPGITSSMSMGSGM
ncbi:hypothetical protein J3R30DRAFT_2726279 [Lentinula aciculospora]|uniref:Uncharacterized protein n=1 Tax=Lentinula aciculospora TaxID=153920 RepID=A0A9W9DPB1_9AGAR|nr:hypothetical protein J3R30DRAFT_2726279 [Lentinula aciculospora]